MLRRSEERSRDLEKAGKKLVLSLKKIQKIGDWELSCEINKDYLRSAVKVQ